MNFNMVGKNKKKTTNKQTKKKRAKLAPQRFGETLLNN